ncbi:IS66 family insertion sequence element accessory protein TnpA [Vibrio parahaemolyticus]|uniref:IS66 family insertion sequence element accessory protein TnpA n=1 Tax=Vibrio parahaemolyticus TaxID=670 RepID=UPI004037E3C0
MTIFQEQQQSGLSIARFCKQNQLAPKTFRRRQKRLEEQNTQGFAASLQPTLWFGSRPIFGAHVSIRISFRPITNTITPTPTITF